jgi:hypothetical protein
VGRSEGKSADIEIVFGKRFKKAAAAQLLCAANPTMHHGGKPSARPGGQTYCSKTTSVML